MKVDAAITVFCIELWLVVVGWIVVEWVGVRGRWWVLLLGGGGLFLESALICEFLVIFAFVIGDYL